MSLYTSVGSDQNGSQEAFHGQPGRKGQYGVRLHFLLRPKIFAMKRVLDTKARIQAKVSILLAK